MKYILLLVFTTALLSSASFAQYKGGSNDGFGWLQAKGMLHAMPGIYKGGHHDGYSALAASAQNSGPEIYHGGSNDGVAALQAKGIQNMLPGIYSGGTDDGVSNVAVLKQNLLPGIYSGGLDDGVAMAFTASLNSMPSIYLGGVNDGADMFGVRGLLNRLPEIYLGGGNADDGYSFTVALRQNINDPAPDATDHVRTIALLQLSGAWFNDDAVLAWEMLAGPSIEHFELQRSMDGGTSFTTIALVQPNADTAQPEYRYTDVRAYHLAHDQLLYRLRSVDRQGGSLYSTIVRLPKDRTAPVIVAYPNPSSGRFTLALLNVPELHRYSYQLTGADGRMIRRGHILEATSSFDLSGFAAATYHLFLFRDGKPIQHFTILLTP